jgi:membrane protease YdiL (CAAX protease family)
VPYAEAVDVDDPFDVPVAEVITDPSGVPLRPRPSRRRRHEPPPIGWQRLLPVFIGYALMMAVSIAFAVLLIAAALNNAAMDEDDQHWALFAVEAIDTVLVLVVAFAVGRPPAKTFDLDHRLGTWFIGFPLLAMLLVMNIGMTLFLRRAFGVEGDVGPQLTAVTVLLMCVQPAIVEEWFFRHLALGSLREKIGTQWAVWVSAIMFSMAHIFNPVGMPYLLLLGVALGYLRIHSCSLALPMLLHFLHNFAVLLSNRFM